MKYLGRQSLFWMKKITNIFTILFSEKFKNDHKVIFHHKISSIYDNKSNISKKLS